MVLALNHSVAIRWKFSHVGGSFLGFRKNRRLRLCLGLAVGVMASPDLAQAEGGGLRGNVALRLGEHFVADQEFAYSSATEERQIKVHMEVPTRAGRRV